MTRKFDKYIVWQSMIRGQENRDSRLCECSTLASAMALVNLFPFKSSVWIEPVRIR